MAKEVNWLVLGKAFELYIDLYGYKKVDDLPWIVDKDIHYITCDIDNRIFFESENRTFVGSAEQSFLQLEKDKKLGKGCFIACSPCWRREKNIDELHQNYFMKIEIYKNIDVTEHGLDRLISDCYSVFQQFCSESDELEIVKTTEGFDIELNGIEIGSYGIRRYQDIEWIYGTGLAEPRFSVARSKNLKND